MMQFGENKRRLSFVRSIVCLFAVLRNAVVEFPGVTVGGTGRRSRLRL